MCTVEELGAFSGHLSKCTNTKKRNFRNLSKRYDLRNFVPGDNYMGHPSVPYLFSPSSHLVWWLFGVAFRPFFLENHRSSGPILVWKTSLATGSFSLTQWRKWRGTGKQSLAPRYSSMKSENRNFLTPAITWILSTNLRSWKCGRREENPLNFPCW